ncbi:MAG: lamin tail domain-containing protein [Deltaproteobacteria bacterium]|nr:lamin tail domain-containing protein [Deltaproteobacteria bacterium]
MKNIYIFLLLGLFASSCGGMPELTPFEGISTNYSDQANPSSSTTHNNSPTSATPTGSSSGTSSSSSTNSKTASTNTASHPTTTNPTSTTTPTSTPLESQPAGTQGAGAETQPATPTGSAPTPAETFLVLNEILYDATGSDTDGNEFIELYGSSEMDISGYQILIINGSDGKIIDTINLPQGAKTRANGLYLIADLRTNSSNSSNISNADFMDNFDPQNGPDAIQLLSPRGELKDALAYGEGGVAEASNGLATGRGNPALDVASGHSLSRRAGVNTNDNAADFMDLETPSPGSL